MPEVMSQTKQVSDAYGAYAFGVVAFVLILSALVVAGIMVWTRMLKPMFREQAAIAASQATTARDIAECSKNLTQLQTTMATAQTAWMRYTLGHCPTCGDPDMKGSHGHGRLQA